MGIRMHARVRLQDRVCTKSMGRMRETEATGPHCVVDTSEKAFEKEKVNIYNKKIIKKLKILKILKISSLNKKITLHAFWLLDNRLKILTAQF